MKRIIKTLFVIAIALLLVQIDLVQLDFVTVLIGFTVFTGLFIPVRYFRTGQLFMAIDINIWKKYIIEALRADNSFMFKSKDDSGFVLGGAVVYIPQAGADPVVVINRNAYPGVAVRRTDTDVNYALDSYSTDPTHIPWAELQTISYDKIDSVLGGHTMTLGQAVAANMLIKWAQTNALRLVKTTGNNVAPIGTQVNDRKGFDQADLKKAMIRMNLDDVPSEGRVCLIDDNMYEYFYDSLSDKFANAFNQFADNKNGIVGRLHGFDIMRRSSVLAYSNVDAVNAFGAALAATDNLASICWHPKMVCRAFGDMKPFQDKDNPLYYGDIYSMIVRAGGRKERADFKGVVSIIQDAA